MSNPDRPPAIGTEDISDFLARFDDDDWGDWEGIEHPVIGWLRAIDRAQPWGIEIRPNCEGGWNAQP